MSIVLQSSGGGQITLLEPTTASNFTQTLPSATGTVMVSGNMPAFSAYKSGADQTVTTQTFNKITFETEKFDTNNNFASSRFTPTVAGYYQVNAVLRYSGTALNNVLIALYKNGTTYERGVETGILSTANASGQISSSCLVYCDGVTDYLEIYGYMDGTGVLKFTQVSSNTSCIFSAVMVRAA